MTQIRIFWHEELSDLRSLYHMYQRILLKEIFKIETSIIAVLTPCQDIDRCLSKKNLLYSVNQSAIKVNTKRKNGMIANETVVYHCSNEVNIRNYRQP